MMRRILGNEYPDTLLVMSNLTVACFNLRGLQEAAELELEVLETREMVLGKDHPLSLGARIALAAIRDAIDTAAVATPDETKKGALGLDNGPF